MSTSPITAGAASREDGPKEMHTARRWEGWEGQGQAKPLNPPGSEGNICQGQQGESV